MRISFSKDARIDIERLRDFISKNNPIVAKRIVENLIHSIETLADYPEMGTKVKEFPMAESLRDIYVLDYHVRYLKLKNNIHIVRIWHQEEDR